MGLVQHEGGPCGVLAAIQVILWSPLVLLGIYFSSIDEDEMIIILWFVSEFFLQGKDSFELALILC